MFNPDEVFPIFFVIWGLLGLFSFLFFTFCKKVILKRRVLPIFTIGAGVLFLGFGYLMGFPGDSLTFMIPMVILITIINLYSIKFCGKCSKMIHNRIPFIKKEFCPKCGSKLNV